MLNLDRKRIQDVQHLFNHLTGREGFIRVWAQPSLNNRASLKVQEVALDTFLSEHSRNLWQQVEPIHGLTGSHLATGREGDASMILVIGVIHLSEKLASLTFFSLKKPSLDRLLLFLVVSVIEGILEPVKKLNFLLSISDRLRSDSAATPLSGDKLGLNSDICRNQVFRVPNHILCPLPLL